MMQVKTNKISILPFILMVAAGAAYTSASSAQIVTDGSLGPSITLDALDVEIIESLGTRAGNNLFHSFESFNITEGGSATFTGALDINNVISRVTGGEVSTIQGVLRSQIDNADFYFVNPAGVTFGPGGSVDVPASFHLGAADAIEFSDKSVFTIESSSSTLTTANPVSFGFLDARNGDIIIDGAQFRFESSSRTSLVGSSSGQ